MTLAAELPVGVDWLDALPAYRSGSLRVMMQNTDELTAAEQWLESAGPSNTAPFGAVKTVTNFILVKVVDELKKLLCTDDGYEDDRKAIGEAITVGKMAIVSAVSLAIAPVVGAAAVVIAPVVAVLLSVSLNIAGKVSCEGLTQARASLARTDDDTQPER